MTLEELSKRAPSRAEVWVRLGRARRATGAGSAEVRESFVRALAVAESGSEARRDALVELADLDLSQGDGARAELWLERAADDKAPAIAARLLRGDAAGARALLDKVDLPLTDGRAALVRGQALAILNDPDGFVPLVRAMVLDVPGASEALSSALGHVAADPQVRARVRSVVDAKGEQDLARWRAAFARAEGARDAARTALRDALDAGEVAAALPLLDAAIDDRDLGSLRAALAKLPDDGADALVADARRLARETLDDAVQIRHPRLQPWAEAMALQAARALSPADAQADWPKLLARLDALARAVADLDSVAAVAELAARAPCAWPSWASSTRARARSSTRSSEPTSRRPGCCRRRRRCTTCAGRRTPSRASCSGRTTSRASASYRCRICGRRSARSTRSATGRSPGTSCAARG